MAKRHAVTSQAGNGIRDRIRELRRVPARDLLANPKNWRRHPQAQQDALRGVLTDIGYAGALLARETADGLLLIDGHLRAETTPNALVPVLVLDVTEAEADTLLATLDPLAAMAERDSVQLARLIDGINTDNAAVAALLGELSAPGADVAGALAGLTGDNTPQAKESPQVPVVELLIACDDLAVVEDALLATGETQRGRALAAVCRAYLT